VFGGTAMTLIELETLVKYVMDAEGEQTAVLVPMAVWGEILAVLRRVESGLHREDEDEPKERILADLTEAVRSTQAGVMFPVSELWDRVNVTQDLIPAGAECEVWSPYDAIDAAKIMMRALQDGGDE
jgi:hypothetical protein